MEKGRLLFTLIFYNNCRPGTPDQLCNQNELEANLDETLIFNTVINNIKCRNIPQVQNLSPFLDSLDNFISQTILWKHEGTCSHRLDNQSKELDCNYNPP